MFVELNGIYRDLEVQKAVQWQEQLVVVSCVT